MEPVHPGYLLPLEYPRDLSGTTLVLLYVNDIPNIPFTKDSPLVMYADDLLQYQNDLLTFQCDVNLISQWTLQNHLSLNCSKTEYMFIPAATISISQFMWTTIKLKEFMGTNTWGSGFLITLLGLSILTVPTCNRLQRLLGYIFKTFSPHCSHGLHSPYIQDSFWIV